MAQQNQSPDVTALNETEGIVLIVDALGVSGLDLEGSKKFLEQREAVLNSMLSTYPEHIEKRVAALKKDKAAGTVFSSNAQTLLEALEKRFPLTKYVFGDTMVFVWKCSYQDAPMAFVQFAFWAGVFVSTALLLRLGLRGSFSFGKMIEHSTENTVLGPAVTDAAGWYDKAEWIGIMGTPKTRILLRDLDRKSPRFNLPELLTEYLVPTKLGPIPSPCVYWPMFGLVWDNKNSPYEALRNFSMPVETTAKYNNTVVFIEKCEEVEKSLKEQKKS